MGKFYVTTPIYYVNDKPHIGHSYTTILADVLSRCHRLFGDDVYFLTGTDEHGQKVQKAAEQNNVEPASHCDSVFPRYVELWKKLGISNDDFIRTTQERHRVVVQKVLSELFDKGLIYQAEYKGRYCVPCERFFTEKDIDDKKLCPECGRTTEEIAETNYFFKMSQYQEWLIEYINAHPHFIQPDFRRNETLGFLKKKLDDLCISRPKKRLSWGIELPFDKNYVCYVWFDALINYVSGVGYAADPAKFAKWWPASCHLIGKDILTTHSVYWPIMLKAMGLEMPESIFAHGWWLSGCDKMSKSVGNVVNPMDMIDRYGVDSFRYFLMAEMSLGNDASFNETAFITRYNSDLANDLGNMLSRVIKMIIKNRDSLIPRSGPLNDDDKALADACLAATKQMTSSVKDMKLDKGISAIFAAVRHANKYFEASAPWKLAKENNAERLDTVLYCGVEALRIISGLLSPIMPEKACELRKALGFSSDELPSMKELHEWGILKPGTKLADIPPLFPRIDSKGKEDSGGANLQFQSDNLITIDDFSKVKLKTAKVLAAEKIDGADKLLKLQVEIGNEKRQIVAGVAKFYTADEIIGMNIVVVSNLKPAKIRGIESYGMLLAAKTGGELKLISVTGEIKSGADVG